MCGSRGSARLRMRSRISYAPPSDDLEDIGANDEIAADDAEAQRDQSENESRLATLQIFHPLIVFFLPSKPSNLHPAAMAAQPTAIGDQPATMPNPTEATTASGDKNQNNNTNRNRNIFRWADLPAELRNKIYELTLTATAPIAIEAVKIPGSDSLRLQHQRPEEPPFRPGHLLRRGTKFLGDVPAYNRHLTYHSAPTYTLSLAPALLLLNKTTYLEAGPILHANHLHFAQPVAFAVYIDRLSPRARAWLKEVTLGLELRARSEVIVQWNGVALPLRRRAADDDDTYHAPTADRARFWPGRAGGWSVCVVLLWAALSRMMAVWKLVRS
ncbi:hypothetical protein SLS54_008336 [Diplodia seriata]